MNDEGQGCWFTTKTGVHVFVKDGQTVEEALEERFGTGKSGSKGNSAIPTGEKTVSSELESLLGEEFKGVKGQAAIDKLMKEKRGYVKGAFHRKDIGDIDLLWGNDNLGLQHIIAHREAEKAGHAKEVLTYLSDAIEKGEFKKKNDRGNFEFAYSEAGYKFKVIIAPEYHGKRITYLLTAFRRDKK